MPTNVPTIHGFAPSTYVRTARMALEEKGVAHALEPLAFREPSHGDLHPFLKMPALTHGAVHVFETAGIVAYVDRAFEGPALFPEEPRGLARAWQWISAANDYVYGAVVALEEGSGDAEVDAARAALNPFGDALADAPFLGGDAASAADLFLFPMVAYARRVEPGRACLAACPEIERWHDQMAGRPSATRTEPT